MLQYMCLQAFILENDVRFSLSDNTLNSKTKEKINRLKFCQILDNPFKVYVMFTKMACDFKFIPFDKNTHRLDLVFFIANPLTPEQVLAKASNPISGM